MRQLFLASKMPFLVKQPSRSPRVLCATHCPPHDIFHDISDFRLYYDPLYFPNFFASMFDSSIKVSDWLLIELRRHFECCRSCPFLRSGLHPFIDEVLYWLLHANF